MKKLSDFTLLSDMDGTLLGPDGRIPARNIEAIRRFTGKGGRFGVATGRSRGFMLDIAKELPINAPCVLYNGGALYDFAGDTMLEELFLPDTAGEYINRILEAMPHLSAAIVSGDDYMQVQEERTLALFSDDRVDNLRLTPPEEIPQPWYKTVFRIREEDFDAFFALTDSFAHPGVRFVGTYFTLTEMLPEESSKGYMLGRLIERGYVARENLVAVGDFYNDLEMIELAGIGATLNTAPDALKAKADLIVGDCGGGAVADVIEHLEELCGEPSPR